MSKNKIIAAVFVFIVLILSIFLFFISSNIGAVNDTISFPKPSHDSCSNNSNSDECIMFTALDTNNLDLCSKMSVKGFNMLVSFDMSRCQSGVSQKLIKLNRFKTSDCVNFDDVESRNYCYKTNAVIEKKASLCINTVQNKDDIQKGVDTKTKIDNCYSDVGVAIRYTASSVEECNSMDYGPGDRINIKYDCIRSLAVKTNNSSMCHLASFMSEDCTTTIAEKTSSYTLCDSLVNMYDRCYLQVAGSKQDKSQCYKIKDEHYRNLCNGKYN